MFLKTVFSHVLFRVLLLASNFIRIVFGWFQIKWIHREFSVVDRKTVWPVVMCPQLFSFCLNVFLSWLPAAALRRRSSCWFFALAWRRLGRTQNDWQVGVGLYFWYGRARSESPRLNWPRDSIWALEYNQWVQRTLLSQCALPSITFTFVLSV